jgi:hypothetical protein
MAFNNNTDISTLVKDLQMARELSMLGEYQTSLDQFKAL